jgi:hypothetical protein
VEEECKEDPTKRERPVEDDDDDFLQDRKFVDELYPETVDAAKADEDFKLLDACDDDESVEVDGFEVDCAPNQMILDTDCVEPDDAFIPHKPPKMLDVFSAAYGIAYSCGEVPQGWYYNFDPLHNHRVPMTQPGETPVPHQFIPDFWLGPYPEPSQKKETPRPGIESNLFVLTENSTKEGIQACYDRMDGISKALPTTSIRQLVPRKKKPRVAAPDPPAGDMAPAPPVPAPAAQADNMAPPVAESLSLLHESSFADARSEHWRTDRLDTTGLSLPLPHEGWIANIAEGLPTEFDDHPLVLEARRLHDSHSVPHTRHWRTELPMSIMAAQLVRLVQDAQGVQWPPEFRTCAFPISPHSKRLHKLNGDQCQLPAFALVSTVNGTCSKSWNGHRSIRNVHSFEQALDTADHQQALEFCRLLGRVVVAETGMAEHVLKSGDLNGLYKYFMETRRTNNNPWSSAYFLEDDYGVQLLNAYSNVVSLKADKRASFPLKDDTIKDIEGLNWEMTLVLERVLPDFGRKVLHVWDAHSNEAKGKKNVDDFLLTKTQREALFSPNDGLRLWEMELYDNRCEDDVTDGRLFEQDCSGDEEVARGDVEFPGSGSENGSDDGSDFQP